MHVSYLTYLCSVLAKIADPVTYTRKMQLFKMLNNVSFCIIKRS
jgi:hypothetical protein